MIEFSIDLAQILTLLSGIVLPLVVGLVTNTVTKPGVKAVLLAALSVGISIIAELANALTNNIAYDLGAALVTGVGTFLVAVGIYKGFWKPVGAGAATQSVKATTLL